NTAFARQPRLPTEACINKLPSLTYRLPRLSSGSDSLYRWAWNLSQIQKKRQQHSGSARAVQSGRLKLSMILLAERLVSRLISANFPFGVEIPRRSRAGELHKQHCPRA